MVGQFCCYLASIFVGQTGPTLRRGELGVIKEEQLWYCRLLQSRFVQYAKTRNTRRDNSPRMPREVSDTDWPIWKQPGR